MKEEMVTGEPSQLKAARSLFLPAIQIAFGRPGPDSR